MSTHLNILGISGSLRKKSYNTAILHAAQKLAPPEMTIDIFDLSTIPLYNEDIREQSFPFSVLEFRQRIRNCDGILISTPEYNYSIPGVLKNAIDWASRPPEQPFEGKSIAIMGASPGALGTVRAQMDLRQCFIYLNGLTLNRPEIYIGQVKEKVIDGNLVHEKTQEVISQLLTALALHIINHEAIKARKRVAA